MVIKNESIEMKNTGAFVVYVFTVTVAIPVIETIYLGKLLN